MRPGEALELMPVPAELAAGDACNERRRRGFAISAPERMLVGQLMRRGCIPIEDRQTKVGDERRPDHCSGHHGRRGCCYLGGLSIELSCPSIRSSSFCAVRCRSALPGDGVKHRG